MVIDKQNQIIYTCMVPIYLPYLPSVKPVFLMSGTIEIYFEISKYVTFYILCNLPFSHFFFFTALILGTLLFALAVSFFS